MVTPSTLLVLQFGDYSLSAIRRGSAPPPGRDGATSISFQTNLRSGFAEATADLAEGSLSLSPGITELKLSQPILGENSTVDVYLSGPIPTMLLTGPRRDSCRLMFSDRDLQHFQISYHGAVGDVSWRWEVPAGSIEVTLECFPTKLDYRSDYAAIRAELELVAPTLIASAGGTTSAGFGESGRTPQASDLEWLSLLQQRNKELTESMTRLLPNLRRNIQVTGEITTRERMRRGKPANRRAYAVGRPTASVAVSRLVNGEATPTNGHLKWEIERLRTAALAVASAEWFAKLDESLSQPVSQLVEDSAVWLRRLRHIPSVMALPNMQVRLRDPLYEAAFRSIRSLRLSLEPLEGAHPVGLKDLPTLYEYWVFLRIVEIVKRRYPFVRSSSQALVQRAGADLVMTPGRRSAVTLADHAGHEILCQYNRLFTKLPTTNQRPDAVISLQGANKMLLVDAKYRIGRDPRYMQRYGVEGPLPDDINVLHRYRDAIVNTTSKSFGRLSQAGLIVFPGAESVRYQKHHFYRSWFSVRIGGMPLLPSGSSLIEQALNDYFEEIELEGRV